LSNWALLGGTGKTFAIAAVVAALASQDETVLITLHTPAASSRPCGRAVEPMGLGAGWAGRATDNEGRLHDDVPGGGSSLVQPLGGGFDGELGHLGCVLPDHGEVDEGEPGDAAVVVADHRDVVWDVQAGAAEGGDDAVGATVVGGEDRAGWLVGLQQRPGCLGAGLLGVVAGKDADVVLQVVSTWTMSRWPRATR
jgi:hypothetical protein